MPLLKPGQQYLFSNLENSWNLKAAPTVDSANYLTVTIDARNKIDELDEKNNALSQQYIVEDPRVYFVSDNGSDETGDGSAAKPWRYLNSAWMKGRSGDVVYIGVSKPGFESKKKSFYINPKYDLLTGQLLPEQTSLRSKKMTTLTKATPATLIPSTYRHYFNDMDLAKLSKPVVTKSLRAMSVESSEHDTYELDGPVTYGAEGGGGGTTGGGGTNKMWNVSATIRDICTGTNIAPVQVSPPQKIVLPNPILPKDPLCLGAEAHFVSSTLYDLHLNPNSELSIEDEIEENLAKYVTPKVLDQIKSVAAVVGPIFTGIPITPNGPELALTIGGGYDPKFPSCNDRDIAGMMRKACEDKQTGFVLPVITISIRYQFKPK